MENASARKARSTGSTSRVTRHDSNRHSCKPECFRRLRRSRGGHTPPANSNHPAKGQLNIGTGSSDLGDRPVALPSPLPRLISF
ncbi:hypothetical protein GWI33_006976 [Rhynchophorus ferrugineus]|uniref:Uncharacterized protein n=1 Tax=Rhynchophorus ferrugineus TaxID=354439 RepID=A0A834IKW4_RHYFE|nr:hypothetical protein GWI33_006976 [Rhynchophorus ferrugineus]